MKMDKVLLVVATILVLIFFIGCHIIFNEIDSRFKNNSDVSYAEEVCNLAKPNYKGWTEIELKNFYSGSCLMDLKNQSGSGYPYSKCFEISANRYGLDPEYLAAIASVESSFNPLAESSANAIGLMQIKWPITAQELGVVNKNDLYNPCKNIDLGAKYIALLEDRFDSKLMALAAYYQGPSVVSKTKTIPKRSIKYIEKIYKREKLLFNSCTT